MINSVMNRLQDFTFFSQLMANANMGWWKANLSTANYECSDFIVELLGLDQTGIISFEDFNKRIQKEEQLSTTVHSYGVYQRPEVVYLLDTVKGSVWVRSKVCFQETDEDGNEIIYVARASAVTAAVAVTVVSETLATAGCPTWGLPPCCSGDSSISFPFSSRMIIGAVAAR